jgi:hypothetical protein
MVAVFLKIEVLLGAAQRGLGNNPGRCGEPFMYVSNYQSTERNVREDLNLQHFRNIKSGNSFLCVTV